VSLAPVVQQPAPHYVEYASRDPLSTVLYRVTSLGLGCAPVWQSSILPITAPTVLRHRLAAADLVHVEHPWQFRFVHQHVGNQTPVTLGAHNIEADLAASTAMSAPAWLKERIVREVVSQEGQATAKASLVMATSEDDARRIADLYDIPQSRLAVVPNGVDCELFRPVTNELREQRKRELGLSGSRVVVFAGSLHPPNVQAVETIATWSERWPEQDVIFLVVGSIGRSFAHRASARLRITGSVDQTQPYLEAANVAINPMQAGSGTNLKQLEYMAIGLPTVATPTGVRGIPVINQMHAIIDTIDALPQHLRRLLSDPSEQLRLGLNSRALVESQFNWQTIGAHLRHVFTKVLETRLPVRASNA